MTVRGFEGLSPKADARRVIETVNRINLGKVNVVTTLTLTADDTVTTLTDSRISPQSFIGLSPLTANAAVPATSIKRSTSSAGINAGCSRVHIVHQFIRPLST